MGAPELCSHHVASVICGIPLRFPLTGRKDNPDRFYIFTGNNVAFTATVVAHELGHNLGMLHDNTNASSCSGSYIMSPYATDVFCGKIQCINVDANNPPPGAFITTFNQGGVKCVNAFFDLGSDIPDPGYVHTGTGCGTGKVCNNLGNCYCNYGWAPPHCNTWGYGGSIDSGPTHIGKLVQKTFVVINKL
ncbi:ADAM9 protein, partial [Polypterus senegalus]